MHGYNNNYGNSNNNSYGNNRNNGNSYKKKSYNREEYGGQGNQKRESKKSGCCILNYSNADGDKKSGIRGWNASKSRGLISFIASKRKDSGEYENKRGHNYERWVAKVTFKNTMDVKLISCLYNVTTNKLYFPEHNMVASPSAANGGYFGKCVSK